MALVVSLLAALLGVSAGPTGAATVGAPGAPVDAEVTATIAEEGSAFVIADLAAPANAPAIVGDTGRSVVSNLPAGSYEGAAEDQALPFVAVKVDAEGLAALRADRRVTGIVVNHVNEPTLVSSVPAVGADTTRNLGLDGAGGSVAVIDTGVQRGHPFLADADGNSRVVSEACFSGLGGQYTNVVSVCPDGQPQQTGLGAAAPCALAGCEHGTHVAGIAAGGRAANNGTTAPRYGVAPAASILAAQVFSKFCTDQLIAGSCVPGWRAVAFDSDIALALNWVEGQSTLYGVDAVNLSVGGSLRSPTACDTRRSSPAPSRRSGPTGSRP